MTKTVESIFLIVSTTVGLGVFVLPFALASSGIFFWLWFLFLILVTHLLHLAYGEIIFQVEEKHNLPGLVAKFFGHKFKFPVWLFDFIGINLTFLVYLIASGTFVSIIFPINPIFTKLALFAIVGFITYFSVNPIAKIETILSVLLIAIFLLISFYILPNFDSQNFISNIKNFGDASPFFSYGILIFAFTGYSSLLLVYDLIGKNVKLFKRVNVWALAIIFVLYALYTISVFGALGNKVSEESLTSLSKILPQSIIALGVLFALLNIFTTFIALALYLKRGLIDDFKIKEKPAWFLTNIPILFFAVLPLEKIAGLSGIVGTIFIGVNLILLLLCYQKIKEIKYFNVSKSIVWLLIAIFSIGFVLGLIL